METVFTFTYPNFVSKTASDKAYKAAYEAWSLDMIENHHCTVSIKDICSKLNVTTSWVRDRILPNVEYVKITPTRLKELNMNHRSPLLFNELELRKFLMSAAVFTRQTKVIDLQKHMTEKEIAAALDDPAIARWDEANKHTYGKRSNKLLNMLNVDYENVNETIRPQYEAVEVKPFDFWIRAADLVFSKDYPNRETAYRDFFRKGMVKINLFGKAMFIQIDQLDKIIYPLTVAAK